MIIKKFTHILVTSNEGVKRLVSHLKNITGFVKFQVDKIPILTIRMELIQSQVTFTPPLDRTTTSTSLQEIITQWMNDFLARGSFISTIISKVPYIGLLFCVHLSCSRMSHIDFEGLNVMFVWTTICPHHDPGMQWTWSFLPPTPSVSLFQNSLSLKKYSLHYSPWNYITLHYITLQTLHYITCTWHYITLLTLHVHYDYMYITLHYMWHYFALHYIDYVTWNIPYITLHYITSVCGLVDWNRAHIRTTSKEMSRCNRWLFRSRTHSKEPLPTAGYRTRTF